MEEEMSAIGDHKSKRYQLLRKRRDGQKSRMRNKLGHSTKLREIALIEDVIKSVVSGTQACLRGAELDAFNRQLSKALKKL